MNIISGAGWPASALSNFAGHRFEIDGISCTREGFLQSLKFKSPDMQIAVCDLGGKAAKFKGKKKKWWKEQTLYWQGKPMKRDSKEYQNLLNRMYNACYEQSEKFRKALHATNGKIRHSIGKSNIKETVLTESEFCSRLEHLRDHGLLPVEQSKGMLDNGLR